MALHIMPEDCLNLGHHSLFKLWQNSTYRYFGRILNMEKWKNAKILFLFTRPLKIFFYKTTEQNSKILHTNSVSMSIKVCLNGGATYIIGKIIAKTI